MSDVVVGVDDSKHARAALEWAMRYCQREQLSLTVLTVIDPLVESVLWDASLGTTARDATTAAARADAWQMVREAVEHAGPPEVDVDVRAVVGHPVKELVAAADGAELIVVGSRGAGAFARLLLGSTSSGIAHHAPCSVMIVRETDRSGPAKQQPR